MQQKREDDLVASFDDLMDLSDPNALNVLKKKPLVRDFLIKQQQKGRIGTWDAILAQQQRAGTSTSPTTVPTPEPDLSASTVSSIAESDVQSMTGSMSSISIDDSTKDSNYVPSETELSIEDLPKVKKQDLNR